MHKTKPSGFWTKWSKSNLPNTYTRKELQNEDEKRINEEGDLKMTVI